MLDDLGERTPLHIFHGNENLAGILANFVDRADVRMIQSRCGASLTSQALIYVQIAGGLLRDKLQRYGTMQGGVFGAINDAHPSATEGTENAVVRYKLSRQRI